MMEQKRWEGEQEHLKRQAEPEEQKIKLEMQREERLLAESQRRDDLMNAMCQILSKFTPKP